MAVVWPADNGERAIAVLLLGLMVLYGVGLGFLLNSRASSETAAMLPKLLVSLNAAWLISSLLVDFLSALRPVTRPLPEHFPVSERQNVLTAFLLDFLTLRRLLLVTCLLTALAVAPRHAAAPGFSLLLVLGATVFSFNLRLLVALRRWRHPLLAAHLLSLGLMGWWLAVPTAPYAPTLGIAMALLPWLLWVVQLRWLAPYFSARYLPAEAAPAVGSAPSRLPLVWKAYLRKTWLPLMMSTVFKVLLLVITGLFMVEKGKIANQGFFYLAFLPTLSFTYVNNNLFAFLNSITANEVQRLGLTPRLTDLYFRLVGPIVLIECLLAALVLLMVFPTPLWPLLGLLPLGAAALLSIGLWASLYQAKPVAKAADFANMRKNTSTLMSIVSLVVAALLYFLPWWWARITLALLVAASAAWPMRQVRQNEGELRRRLWQGIGA